ncbi:hypothetical protein D3C81_1906630 [compost metagenome]
MTIATVLGSLCVLRTTPPVTWRTSAALAATKPETISLAKSAGRLKSHVILCSPDRVFILPAPELQKTLRRGVCKPTLTAHPQRSMNNYH